MGHTKCLIAAVQFEEHISLCEYLTPDTPPFSVHLYQELCNGADSDDEGKANVMGCTSA